jgi:Flp pilus assembly pilin Flp
MSTGFARYKAPAWLRDQRGSITAEYTVLLAIGLGIAIALSALGVSLDANYRHALEVLSSEGP